MTQQLQSDSKCVIKCFVGSGSRSFSIDIHVLFVVTFGSRYCEPMLVTLRLSTSPWLLPLREEARGQWKRCPFLPLRRKFSLLW